MPLYKGLEDAGRKTSKFMGDFAAAMSARHLEIIKAQIPPPDFVKMKANIALLEVQMARYEDRVAKGQPITDGERKQYNQTGLVLVNTRKKLKAAREEEEERMEAAEAALIYFRAHMSEPVKATLTVCGQEKGQILDRLIQVGNFLEYVRRNWGGNPVSVAKFIDDDLLALLAAKTGPELARLVTKAKELRLEREMHYGENPKAVAAGNLRAGMNDQEFIQFIRMRISNRSTDRQLGQLITYLDKPGREKPLSLKEVEERIILACQEGIRSVDEIGNDGDANGALLAAAAAAGAVAGEVAANAAHARFLGQGDTREAGGKGEDLGGEESKRGQGAGGVRGAGMGYGQGWRPFGGGGYPSPASVNMKCFEFTGERPGSTKGKCKFGSGCRFQHDDAETGEQDQRPEAKRRRMEG
jgi:hypothetical protein